MHAFAYHRPESVDAAAALRASRPDAVFLAGGMTLLPTLKQRLASPSDVIDLGAIRGLDGIEARGDKLVIGALARHAAVAESEAVRKALPALAGLAAHIGDAQVRNRGTLGGSVANSDPAADYPAAIVALGATMVTSKRSIAADSFFKGLFETALEPAEIIRAIEFPVPRRAAYRKFAHPASRYAIVGVFVADFGGRVRVGVTGAGPCAFRAATLEEALTRKLDPAAIDGAAIAHDRFNNDLAASAEFRAHLVRVMARRAVADIVGA